MTETIRTFNLPDPADLLRELLDERGLSQSDFAAMLDLPRSAVSDLLAGRTDLSRTDWGRWFGALGYRLVYNLEATPTMGFFVHSGQLWPWLLKKLARGRKPTPTRAAGELLNLLEQAGVGQRDWPRLLPAHLKPVFDSGWLWHQGDATAAHLAGQVRALLEGASHA